LSALRLKPDFADAQYALGLIALFEHDFARGWAGYERRFETNPPVAQVQPPRRPRARDLAGVRRLAVRAEQGLGDQILFSTLLPELAAHNVQAAVEIDPRLAPIYRRSLPQFEYDAAALATCDQELPIGSLPSFLRPTLGSFAAQPRSLLSPDPQRASQARGALGAGPHVAISWRSFQKAGRRHIGERKSAPLEAFAPLGRCARLVDLQYGDVDEERRAFDARCPGVRSQVPGLDLRDDIDGILATLAACDLVVTTSNVTAHFAGAIGKRTWLVYLGANPPFHYWAPRGDGRSLWYPSVEIVTDASWTSWQQALAAVARRLAAG
jgi:hypothetical protein